MLQDGGLRDSGPLQHLSGVFRGKMKLSKAGLGLESVSDLRSCKAEGRLQLQVMLQGLKNCSVDPAFTSTVLNSPQSNHQCGAPTAQQAAKAYLARTPCAGSNVVSIATLRHNCRRMRGDFAT